MLRTVRKNCYAIEIKKENFELYADYLISPSGNAAATGWSSMLDGEISHDKVTRFLSEDEYTSNDPFKSSQANSTENERSGGGY